MPASRHCGEGVTVLVQVARPTHHLTAAFLQPGKLSASSPPEPLLLRRQGAAALLGEDAPHHPDISRPLSGVPERGGGPAEGIGSWRCLANMNFVENRFLTIRPGTQDRVQVWENSRRNQDSGW